MIPTVDFWEVFVELRVSYSYVFDITLTTIQKMFKLY